MCWWCQKYPLQFKPQPKVKTKPCTENTSWLLMFIIYEAFFSKFLLTLIHCAHSRTFDPNCNSDPGGASSWFTEPLLLSAVKGSQWLKLLSQLEVTYLSHKEHILLTWERMTQKGKNAERWTREWTVPWNSWSVLVSSSKLSVSCRVFMTNFQSKGNGHGWGGATTKRNALNSQIHWLTSRAASFSKETAESQMGSAVSSQPVLQELWFNYWFQSFM